jgi:hypothetical protein
LFPDNFNEFPRRAGGMTVEHNFSGGEHNLFQSNNFVGLFNPFRNRQTQGIFQQARFHAVKLSFSENHNNFSLSLAFDVRDRRAGRCDFGEHDYSFGLCI